MTATTWLPEPTPPAWGLNVFVATAYLSERFIAVLGTVEEAKAAVEAHEDATPYFADTMTWVEADPLPPLPGHRYARRQWIGTVVTDPHGSPMQFRVVEQRVQNVIGL